MQFDGLLLCYLIKTNLLLDKVAFSLLFNWHSNHSWYQLLQQTYFNKRMSCSNCSACSKAFACNCSEKWGLKILYLHSLHNINFLNVVHCT